ncbi:gamma-glutamyl-gamma-aminobutyrate hydrolase family protein [Paraburkholderia sp.]|uniref:gamma-glutamyl-gamma-aminobutyrate hydrolase family protein n=1 Tax=Paraburkholderia sp. TaxID=1926495 RepID=UPI0023866CD6|nr:gamma-glutamyl-gamma-aminobutyrate hydrolase family protein [Paraburkholderia sp.]MDE1180385.1 gamma-glutamyl-gamma-aminobutyrate hydrolase family protein [Paraburkholderia sp.]
MRTQIVVGVSADRMKIGLHASHAVGEKYLDPVVDGAHALAVVVPALGDRQSADAIFQCVDGLLFTGSYSNVEPHRYGGAASAPGTLHDPYRDATTLPLMRAAIERGVPMLAICRGFQEMNVVFGGTLHQAVHDVEGYADHRENKVDPIDVQYAPAHALRIERDGVLHRCSGVLEAMVNSLHGQGIDRLGDGLQIEARAPDGLIEAISVKGGRSFALGLQWHPEWRHADNPLSTAIFRAFGDACRERRRLKDERLGSAALDAASLVTGA